MLCDLLQLSIFHWLAIGPICGVGAGNFQGACFWGESQALLQGTISQEFLNFVHLVVGLDNKKGIWRVSSISVFDGTDVLTKHVEIVFLGKPLVF